MKSEVSRTRQWRNSDNAVSVPRGPFHPTLRLLSNMIHTLIRAHQIDRTALQSTSVWNVKSLCEATDIARRTTVPQQEEKIRAVYRTVKEKNSRMP